MFEISWSELLILAIVTLVFVGPKELPVFLRTLGRYAGTIRRHANEFRGQFDAAMREVELEAMKKEIEEMQTKINSEVMSAQNTPLTPGTGLDTKAMGLPTATSAAEARAAAESKMLPMPPMPAPPTMAPPAPMDPKQIEAAAAASNAEA